MIKYKIGGKKKHALRVLRNSPFKPWLLPALRRVLEYDWVPTSRNENGTSS